MEGEESITTYIGTAYHLEHWQKIQFALEIDETNCCESANLQNKINKLDGSHHQTTSGGIWSQLPKPLTRLKSV